MSEFDRLEIEPVEAAVHRSGAYRPMGSVASLADTLLNYWPEEKKDAAYWDAVQACHDALQGTIDREVAREAFIAAAKRARFSLR